MGEWIQHIQITFNFLAAVAHDAWHRIFDNAGALGAYHGIRDEVQLASGKFFHYDVNDTLPEDGILRIKAHAQKGPGNWVRRVAELNVEDDFGMIPGLGWGPAIAEMNTILWQKALRFGFPLFVGSMFLTSGTSAAFNTDVNARGIRKMSGFVLTADTLAQTYIENTDRPYNTSFRDIMWLADGKDSQGNKIGFVNATAVRVWNYNTAEVPGQTNIYRVSSTLRMEGCVVEGKDRYSILPKQQFKIGVDLKAPNGAQITDVEIRGADGETSSDTTLLKIRSSRTAMSCIVSRCTFELGTRAVDMVASFYPGHEGWYFSLCTIQGVQNGISIVNNGYMSPYFSILNTHIKAAKFCVYWFNVTQGHIQGCDFYNQGNNEGAISAFIVLETCSGIEISFNDFLVTLEGGATNDVYGILVNSFQFDPYIPCVRIRICHNYFATLGPPMNTPAVWLQSLLVLLCEVYNNTAAGFRPNQVWIGDNEANQFYDNTPSDIADGFQLVDVTPVDPADLSKGYKLYNLTKLRSRILTLRNSAGKRITQIVAEYGHEFNVRAPAGTIFVHNENTLIMAGRRDYVAPINNFVITFRGISPEGVTRGTQEISREHVYPVVGEGTSDPAELYEVQDLWEVIPSNAPTATQQVIAGTGAYTEGSGATGSYYINQHMSSGPDTTYTGGGVWEKGPNWPAGMEITPGPNATCTVSAPSAGSMTQNLTVEIRFTATGGGTISQTIFLTNVNPVTQTGLVWVSGDSGITKGTSNTQAYIGAATYSDGSTVVNPSGAVYSVTGTGMSITQSGQLTAASTAVVGSNAVVSLTQGGFTITKNVTVYADNSAPYQTSMEISGNNPLTEGGSGTDNLSVIRHWSSGPDTAYTSDGTFAKEGDWPAGMSLTNFGNATASVSSPPLGSITANRTVQVSFTYPGGVLYATIALTNVADTTTYSIARTQDSLTEGSGGQSGLQMKKTVNGVTSNYTDGGNYGLPSSYPNGLTLSSTSAGAATLSAPAAGSMNADLPLVVTFTFPDGSTINTTINLINVADVTAQPRLVSFDWERSGSNHNYYFKFDTVQNLTDVSLYYLFSGATNSSELRDGTITATAISGDSKGYQFKVVVPTAPYTATTPNYYYYVRGSYTSNGTAYSFVVPYTDNSTQSARRIVWAKNLATIYGVTAEASSSYTQYGLVPNLALRDILFHATQYWQAQGSATGAWLAEVYPDLYSSSEITLVSLCDDFNTRTTDPDETTTGNLYVITAFDVQVRDTNASGGWRTVTSVAGNNKIICRVSFPAEAFSAIRVLIKTTADGAARIVSFKVKPQYY